MPYKDKEKEKEYQKEYQKLWRENNKEKNKEYYKKRYENNKEYYKEYYEDNKEKIKENDRLWRENNKEKRKEYFKKKNKEYNKTEKGIKSKTISHWKFYGVKNDDFDKLYDYYLNCKFCEECKVDLTLYKKCLDHDHTTGLFRNVVCNRCNCKRGFIDRGHIKITGAEIYWKRKLREFILS